MNPLPPRHPALPAWLYWGTRRLQAATERRKVFTTNLSCLIALGSIGLYAALYLLTANQALLQAVMAMPAFLLAFGATPWLNRMGLVHTARWVFCVSLPLLGLVVIHIGQGTALNFHAYFLLFGMAPMMFFPLRNWRPIVLFFVLNLCIYLHYTLHPVAPDPALLRLPAWQRQALAQAHQVTALATLLFIIGLSEYFAGTNETQLQATSQTDPLTGVGNRRHLDLTLQTQWRLARRSRQSMAVAMVDVDLFKAYNDHYGHAAGDQCLRAVAGALQAALRRDTDAVMRYGGEEFVLLLPGADLAAAVQRARHACDQVHALRLPHAASPTGWLTVSVGVHAVLPGGSHTPDALLHAADQALYMAKQAGRNQVRPLAG